MALERNITADDDFFLGEDKTLEDTIYQSDNTTPQNVSGWALSWMLKQKATDADADALVTKTTSNGGIAITGTYNADPALNTQRVRITVEGSNTASLVADTYRHELRRTDAGFKTVLTYGACELRQAVHR